MRSTRSWNRQLWLGLLLALCATPALAGGDMVWWIQGPHVRHALVGSVHMLPESAWPLKGQYEQAYEDTRELVLETDPGPLSSGGVTQQFATLAMSPGGLTAEVGKTLSAQVGAVLQQQGLPAGLCEPMKAWACAISLQMLPLQQAGMASEYGVDLQYAHRANQDGRPIHSLETTQEQISLLTDAGPELSRELLEDTVRGFTDPDASPELLIKAWEAGDVNGILDGLNDSSKAYPALYDRLIFQRNQRWSESLPALLDGNTPEMIIVGAAHLVGPKGLPALLAAKGYKVYRVQ